MCYYSATFTIILLLVNGYHARVDDTAEGPGRPRRSDDGSPLEVLLQQHAQQLAAMTAEITAMKARQDKAEMNVVFQARQATDPFPVAKGSPMVFGTVLTNVGSGYDDHSGIFTAPVAGTYAFHSTCMAVSSSSFGISVIADDVLVAQCWSTSTATSDLGSTYVTVKLAAGDRVWSRAEHSESVRGAYWTTFGGFLIRPDLQ